MRLFFSFILLAHGVIHMMGFVKAFRLAEIRQLVEPISKPMGLVWLLTTFLFIGTSGVYFTKKEWWPFLAIIAVLFSQILIFLFWGDAKYGTIANILILLTAMPGIGRWQFQQKVRFDTKEVFQNIRTDTNEFVSEEDIKKVPPIVQKWLDFSQVAGEPKIHSLRLRQEGRLKTDPKGAWMHYSADQYFNVEHPGFVWAAHVKANPIIYLEGKDRLQNGEGAMLIKLLSLFPVVNEKSNEKVDSGSLQRYLAEICWFPSAALNDNISWEALGENSARATLISNGKSVSGIFVFDAFGKVLSFKTKRYYGSGKNAKRETWLVEMLEFKEFGDIKIPYKCRVIWKLADGDFNWLNLEITDVEYNVARPR